jgi:hypothetical protein
MKKRTKKFILIPLIALSILAVLSILLYIIHTWSMQNPYDEVFWIIEHPGSNERYVQYTPVLNKDRRIVLGPTIGADYATLRFKDLDSDGSKEAVIETEIFFDWGEYRFPQRFTLKYKKDNMHENPEFILIDSKNFPEKIPGTYK